MKILFVSDRLGGSGYLQSDWIAGMAQSLAEVGHELSWLVAAQSEQDREGLPRPIQLMTPFSSWNSLGVMRLLPRLLSQSFDLVHIFLPSTSFSLLSPLLILLAGLAPRYAGRLLITAAD